MKTKIMLLKKYWSSVRRFEYSYFNNWVVKRNSIKEEIKK